MGDREGRHCFWIHCHWIHEWERLRGFEGGKKKMALKKKKKEWERLCG